MTRNNRNDCSIYRVVYLLKTWGRSCLQEYMSVIQAMTTAGGLKYFTLTALCLSLLQHKPRKTLFCRRGIWGSIINIFCTVLIMAVQQGICQESLGLKRTHSRERRWHGHLQFLQVWPASRSTDQTCLTPHRSTVPQATRCPRRYWTTA